MPSLLHIAINLPTFTNIFGGIRWQNNALARDDSNSMRHQIPVITRKEMEEKTENRGLKRVGGFVGAIAHLIKWVVIIICFYFHNTPSYSTYNNTYFISFD